VASHRIVGAKTKKFERNAGSMFMPSTQNPLTSCNADSHRDRCLPVQKETVTLPVAKRFETGAERHIRVVGLISDNFDFGLGRSCFNCGLSSRCAHSLVKIPGCRRRVAANRKLGNRRRCDQVLPQSVIHIVRNTKRPSELSTDWACVRNRICPKTDQLLKATKLRTTLL
jgi:hypothetical protein